MSTTVPKEAPNGKVRASSSRNHAALRATVSGVPTSVNGKVHLRVISRGDPPPRQTNLARRSREYLTPAEVRALITAARNGGRTDQYGRRDALLILMGYHHGLRVQELVSLRWDQVDFATASLTVNRIKQGKSCVHPLTGEELRALRALKREWPNDVYLFLSERGAPMTPASVRKLLAQAGQQAGIPFPVHPHMLRHACGYKLVNDGKDTRAIQDYLGHKNIRHTERYTALDAKRFRGFFGD